MGKFLTKAGGPLFDPLRDRGNKPGGALYDPVRNAVANNKPGGMFYDPARDFAIKNATKAGGPLYDPVRDAILKGGGSTTMEEAKAAGGEGMMGNYQTDPQTGRIIPMPQPGSPSGLGGVPYGTPGWVPAGNVPNNAGGGVSDQTLQAAMALMSAGQKNAGQPVQTATRASMGSGQAAPYIVRQPGYDN